MTDSDSSPSTSLPSSWAAEESEHVGGGGKTLKIVGVVVAVLALVVIALVVTNPFEKLDPKERAWPATLGPARPDGIGGQGEAIGSIKPTAAPGVYIWNSFDGWHLWVVNGAGVSGVKGTITTTDDRLVAKPAGTGSATVSTKGKVTTFRLNADDAVAGIDFEPGLFSTQLTFELEGADGPIPASKVTLGTTTKAKAVPVVIRKALVKAKAGS